MFREVFGGETTRLRYRTQKKQNSLIRVPAGLTSRDQRGGGNTQVRLQHQDLGLSIFPIIFYRKMGVILGPKPLVKSTDFAVQLKGQVTPNNYRVFIFPPQNWFGF